MSDLPAPKHHNKFFGKHRADRLLSGLSVVRGAFGAYMVCFQKIARALPGPWMLGSKRQVALLALVFASTSFSVSELLYYLLVPNLGRHTERLVAEVVSALIFGYLLASLLNRIYQLHQVALARLRVITEMNHYVRNALHTAVQSTDLPQREQVKAIVTEAVCRIEWTLRNLLPHQQSVEHVSDNREFPNPSPMVNNRDDGDGGNCQQSNTSSVNSPTSGTPPEVVQQNITSASTRAGGTMEWSRLEETRVQQFKRRLEIHLGEVLGSLNRMREEEHSIMNAGCSRDAGNLSFDSLSEELRFQESSYKRHLLLLIEAALQRIRDGTFGICTACGKEFNPKRLDALPWSEYCLDCQEDLEREFSPEVVQHYIHAANSTEDKPVTSPAEREKQGI